MAVRLVRHDTDTPLLSGPAANHRLTAWAGALLFVLLAMEGVTLLDLRQLLVPHVAIGLGTAGPVLLKLSSTGYRFVRYYSGDPEYRASGPPRILLRIVAPVLVLTTLVLLGTGTALLFVPAAVRGAVIFLHKASFAAWFGAAAVHVLGYVWQVPGLIAADLTRRLGAATRRGAGLRIAAATGAVLVGIGLAVALVERAQPWIELLAHHEH